MSEIRDIKPAEPMWQKRSVEKSGQDAGQEPPRKDGKRRERRKERRTDDNRGQAIDEYV
jgi:hypothetical protein